MNNLGVIFNVFKFVFKGKVLELYKGFKKGKFGEYFVIFNKVVVKVFLRGVNFIVNL